MPTLDLHAPMRAKLLLSLCTASLVGCGGPDDHDHPHLTTGEQLYQHHCAPCHRAAGEGRFMTGVPPLRDSALNYRELVDYVRGHGRGEDSRMPSYSQMPLAEAELIAVYVRQELQKKP